MASTRKTKKRTAVAAPPLPIDINLRSGLYTSAKLPAQFNPVSWADDEPIPLIVDFTFDPTNKTRKVLNDNADAMTLVENARFAIIDNLGYERNMPDRALAIHYGNSGISHRRRKDDDSIIAGVFNITLEQQMFNAAAIGILKNIDIPLMVIGEPIKGLDKDMQVVTRSPRNFFESVDLLLHPSPRNSYVSSTWVLAAMAAGMAVVATYSYSLERLSLAFGIRLVDNVISEWKQAANELAGMLPAAQERNEKFAQQLNEQGELALNRLKKILQED